MRYRRFSYTQAEGASRAFREDDFGALASPAITPTGHFLDNDPQTPESIWVTNENMWVTNDRFQYRACMGNRLDELVIFVNGNQ